MLLRPPPSIRAARPELNPVKPNLSSVVVLSCVDASNVELPFDPVTGSEVLLVTALMVVQVIELMSSSAVLTTGPTGLTGLTGPSSVQAQV